MKRSFLAVVMMASLFVIVFYCGLRCGQCNTLKQSIGNQISANDPKSWGQYTAGRYGYVAQIEPCSEPSVFKQDFFSFALHRGTETNFIMQWNDTRKKLVFDGKPISHKTKTIRGAWGSNEYGLTYPVPASDQKDEFSFDTLLNEEMQWEECSGGQNNEIRFYIEWDPNKKWFHYNGPARWKTRGPVLLAKDGTIIKLESAPSVQRRPILLAD